MVPTWCQLGADLVPPAQARILDETRESVASGVYFCRLVAGGETLTRALVLMK